MKYIIFDAPIPDTVIMFPEFVTHLDIKNSLEAIGLIRKPVSAGYCSIGFDGNFCAYGRADSIKMLSRSGDSEILNRFKNFRV